MPADGKYHVVLKGDIVFSTKSRRRAMAEYHRHRAALLLDNPLPPREQNREAVFQRFKADADIQAMKAEWAASFGNKSRKGGKGGRGGV